MKKLRRAGPAILLCGLIGVLGCEAREDSAGAQSESGPVAAVTDSAADSVQAETEGSMASEAAEGESEVAGEPPTEEPVIQRSGIEGRLTVGPTCPVEQAGEACPDRPHRATITVRYAGTDSVATVFSSGEDGTFRVELPPGDYVLDPGEPRMVYDPKAEPLAVTVQEGRFTRVVMRYDSGVR